MSEKNIDKLFEDGLGDFEMKPSDDLWGKIANDIGNTYIPDAGSVSGSSASSGASTSSAVKGGASLGAKLLTWKAAVIGLAGAVGITTAAVVLSDSYEVDSSSKNERSLIIDLDEESVKNLKEVELNSINTDSKRLINVQKEIEESINTSNNALSDSRGDSSFDNNEEKELEESSQVESSNIARKDKEELKNKLEITVVEIWESSIESSEEVNESNKIKKEDSETVSLNSDKEKESPEIERVQGNESEVLNSESNSSNEDSNEVVQEDSKSSSEKLKGSSDRSFEYFPNDQGHKMDSFKNGLDIPSLAFYYEPDTSGLLSDSSFVIDETDNSKKSMFSIIKPSFNPVGIYFGLGTSLESTSFKHGEGQFPCKMYSWSFNGNLGYEFKNGLYLGTGLKLMASELISTDDFEFKVFEQNEEFRITDAYISNGLIETNLSSDWILRNFGRFDEGMYYVEDDEIYEWWEEFNFDDFWEEEDFENEEEYLVYEFNSQMDIVDRVDRTILPFNLGYNYSEGRWSYFGQLNAEIHSVNNWIRDIYFNSELIESYEVKGIRNRAFYGGSVGLGYHLNSGLELRSSIDLTTGLNQHKHGVIEDIRLNNLRFNLSLRWKI